MSSPKVIIYTDGACLGNPGPGGYAAILISPEHTRERVIYGNQNQTTNNQMELMAAIAGLEALKTSCNVVLYSDSTYVIKGMTEWINNWKLKGYRNSKNQPIKNQDLWRKLANIAHQHNISWRWVKAHAGNTYNERADSIAKEQAALSLTNKQEKK